MTPSERAELLRYLSAGVVYLDTPEQRALLRKGLIELAESKPAIFRQARRFATLTDAGRVVALKLLGKVGETIAERGHTGTLAGKLAAQAKD